MKFAVIGFGFVGKAIHTALRNKHDVYIVDPLSLQVSPKYHAAIEAITDVIDGYILCVPTPDNEIGRCDDHLVYEYVRKITEINPKAHILIKSTTSIETLDACQQINPKVTFSPEFLRGSISVDPTQEFLKQDFAIFGGNDGRWWYEVFSELLPIKEVRYLDIKSAGFLKYAENSFLAVKVIFFNELRELYDNIDGCNNYDAMVEALALDPRIGYSHTQVPGPDGRFGFGGHCLPKDTSEFVELGKEWHRPLNLLEKARELNEKYRG